MSLPRLRDDGTATIGQEWLQGRTCFGGASAALAVAAARARFADLPPLRSLQLAFVGPLAGEVSVSPILLRRGKNSAFVGCDIAGGDGIGLRAMLLFMAARASTITCPGPAAPPFDPPEARPIDPGPLAPGFLAKFDLAHGARSARGFVRWARLRDRSGLSAEEEFVAIADALPAAAMRLATQWGPISTTTWQLNLLTDSPATTDGWWLLETETLHSADGGSSQSMTIWNRDGSPQATATQSVAVFV